MYDAMTTALAMQTLSALSINDFRGAVKLVDNLRERLASMNPDAQELDNGGHDKADDSHAAKQLRFEVSKLP